MLVSREPVDAGRPRAARERDSEPEMIDHPLLEITTEELLEPAHFGIQVEQERPLSGAREEGGRQERQETRIGVRGRVAETDEHGLGGRVQREVTDQIHEIGIASGERLRPFARLQRGERIAPEPVVELEIPHGLRRAGVGRPGRFKIPARARLRQRRTTRYWGPAAPDPHQSVPKDAGRRERSRRTSRAGATRMGEPGRADGGRRRRERRRRTSI